MSASLDPSLRGLSGCGCCEGVAAQTPVRIHNRPGLSAIAYRVGRHSLFKQTLLARLSSAAHPALSGLTTREDDDFTIGLLDAWSAVADVLAFYQERIANEAFLRTATERFSVLEMARLIGYRLDPGVAASVYLAFEIESASGAFGQALATGNQVQAPPQQPREVTIQAGVKVQSIPGPDEEPQTFETVESFQARAEHNAIKPRLTQPQPVSTASEQVLLRGATLSLNPGDFVLIKQGNSVPAVKPVVKVTPDDETDSTHLLFHDPPAAFPPFQRVTGAPQTIDGFLDQFASSSGQGTVPLGAGVIEKIVQSRWKLADLKTLIELQNWDGDQFIRMLREETQRSEPSAEIYTFRQRTKVFGYNAPKQATYADRGTPNPPDQWAEWDLETVGSSPPSADPEEANKLFLAESNKKIVPGSYIAVQKGSAAPEVYQVTAVRLRPRTAYGLSAETTELILSASWWNPSTDTFQTIRTATIHAESELLELAPLPISDHLEQETAASEVSGGQDEEGKLPTAVVLDQAYLGLKLGQTVILTGGRVDLEGVIGSEVLTIKQVWIEEGFSVLEFNQNLEGKYRRETAALMANVAPATHGETVEEILGSGNASLPFQRFTLKQPPLTYISAATPSGSQSTLEVRVNDLLWKEAPNFYGRGPEERVYVTQLDDDGNTAVIFGDGIQGARLPTGQTNVKARYRKGIGLGGLVLAGQLSQLMTRPLGVKSALNPLPSQGAEDPDNMEHARRDAPTTILTLDRIVSLKDYEDFARSYAGIDKALATWISRGESRGVFLTVAGPDGAVISEAGQTRKALMEAIAAHCDPNALFEVRSFRPRLFRVAGTIKLKPDRLVEAVQPEIETKLRRHFSFHERQFGQPVPLSEVIAVIHQIDAVKWVDIDALHRSDEPPGWHPILSADFPRQGAAQLLPAELLTLDPAPVELEVTL
jgi:predicted phage baseplate assembly protein